MRWAVYAIFAATTPFIFAARPLGRRSLLPDLHELFVIGFVLTYEPPFGMWIGIFGTVAMSVAILLLIDHPLHRWRQRRAHDRREPAAAPGAASVAPL